jgi:cation:H+ antiporter
MELFLLIALLVTGFILLVKGADFLIEGASSLAMRLSISEIAIALTVVAFGTSTPELIVNIFASFQGKDEITLGNIIGSNIVNILLILGIAGLIFPIKTEKNTVWREIPFALLSVLVLLVLSNDLLIDKISEAVISRSDGIILLAFFSIFLTYVFGISKVEGEGISKMESRSWLKLVLYIIGGLVALIVGGKLVVDSVVKVAAWFEVSEKLIGLTIVAGGTSLPELFTSAVAAHKGKSDIAIGNIVGSNIFNVFFIMGISALITPIYFPPVLNCDLLILISASVLLFVTMFTGKKRSLDRWEAVLFILLYSTYVTYLLFRR